MTDKTAAGVFSLGNRTVNRMGYGAMQLAGPGVFGPPKDRHAALAVLREAVAGRQPHRHQRLLRSSRHQPAHLRGALSLSR
jgi:pyridoxine 4-dehydrogenase